MVDRSRRVVVPAVVQLVGRIADDDVKLHVVSKELGDPSRDVIGMDEGVCVAFAAVAAVERPLTCAAVTTPAAAVTSDPSMAHRLEPDVPILVAESRGD